MDLLLQESLYPRRNRSSVHGASLGAVLELYFVSMVVCSK